MPQPPSNDPTVRRFRRAFAIVYLTLTAAVAVWLLLSIATVLGGGPPQPVRGPRISARADDPRELRLCQQDLERLLTELHREAFDLQARVLRFDIDPSAEWQNWSAAWRMRWSALGWRCRLSELSGTGKSAAIDRMADIHGSLDELQRGYADVVNRFIDRYMERLRKLRKDLTEVRDLVDRAHPQSKRSNVE